jgi:small subunit ribosomal protein S3
MIEREFVKQALLEHQIQEFLEADLRNMGYSHVEIQRTPVSLRIVLYVMKPGKIVGRGGWNIKRLTEQLKTNFNLDNPQLDVKQISNPFVNPKIMAERVVSTLERQGPSKFKAVAHWVLRDVMKKGKAYGIELLISGRIPGARAKRWRFFTGYLKKCGQIAKEDLLVYKSQAFLKSGAAGIQVTIMPSNIVLPDQMSFSEESLSVVTEELDENDKQVSVEEQNLDDIDNDDIPDDALVDEDLSEEEIKREKAKKKKAKLAGVKKKDVTLLKKDAPKKAKKSSKTKKKE